ncbi:MAG: tetratricopeptide repeat protein [Spirochaetales bacterium]|jgi:tetratricopeptide (TPR) repeat protein|nr:tetratricopeptide repeat protein [Spirochaetales bacterium]
MKKIFGFEVPRIALIPDGHSGGGETAPPSPNDAEVYFNRGLAYKNKKDFASARTDWEKVLSIDPAYTAARQNLEELKKNSLADF